MKITIFITIFITMSDHVCHRRLHLCPSPQSCLPLPNLAAPIVAQLRLGATLKNCWQQPLQQRNHQQRDDHCGAVGAKGTQENHQVPMLVHTYLDRFHFRESSRIFEAIIDVL